MGVKVSHAKFRTFGMDWGTKRKINGKLVIDLGGLHPRREQTVNLNDLGFLENGSSYRFKIFHAERRTSESNFRMETTIQFRAVEPPVTSALFD